MGRSAHGSAVHEQACPRPVLDAYGKRLFDEPLAVERRRLYDLYLYLVMFVECSYRNYPTPDIENLATACVVPVLDEIRSA